MTLAALIRKRETLTPANANPAKAANDGQGEGEPLAKLAPLALANPTDAKTADAVTSWGWLLHFADREPLEVYCNPDATHAAILERYPDALAAEPIPERTAPAYEVEWPDVEPAHDDDRRTCSQCANLSGRRCLAAWRGEILASRDYVPVRDIPRRCEGYAPGADDPDTRPGRERWPELNQERGE